MRAQDANGDKWAESRVLAAFTEKDLTLVHHEDRPAILYRNKILDIWQVIVANDQEGISWSFPMAAGSYELSTGGGENEMYHASGRLQVIGGNFAFAWLENIPNPTETIKKETRLIYMVFH